MLEISLDSPVPLGDQLVAGFRQLIASGTLKPGDELPPVRQLAADLGVNLNTVARAYRELEADGLAIAARGRGTRVTASREGAPGGSGVSSATTAPSGTPARAASSPAPTIAATTALHDAITRVLTDAKLTGFSPADVRSCVERMIPHYWPDASRGTASSDLASDSNPGARP